LRRHLREAQAAREGSSGEVGGEHQPGDIEH
jgi:hypothetical protein